MGPETPSATGVTVFSTSRSREMSRVSVVKICGMVRGSTVA